MEIIKLIVGPLLTNCYLLLGKKEAIVIDPGGGLPEILKRIENKKLTFIILTHYHRDHTLCALELKKEKGGKILIGKGEKEFINFEPDEYLEEGRKIKIENETLEIISTPGHTKGSICIVGKNFIFTGDTLFIDGVGRTDLPGGSQNDLENSLKKLKKIIHHKMKIYPGHGPTFEKL